MKKKVGTLLAVTLAAAPAIAGPMHAHHGSNERAAKVDHAKAKVDGKVDTATPDPWAGRREGAQHPPSMPDSPRKLQVQLFVDGMFAMFGVTTPRVLRTGAPACGNVQSKSPTPCNEEPIK